MRDQGVLRTDDVITRFFRLCTEMCVEFTYRLLLKETASSVGNHIAIALSSANAVRKNCFVTLDAYVKLAALMIKCSGGQNIQTKVDLLKKVGVCIFCVFYTLFLL
jgi:CCR4-NOT transcription complex subunit 1